jgi:enoyl-[acyl-carrier protein] reductase I
MAATLGHCAVHPEPPEAGTAFPAHDAAKLITGETLYVDGGYHIID